MNKLIDFTDAVERSSYRLLALPLNLILLGWLVGFLFVKGLEKVAER